MVGRLVGATAAASLALIIVGCGHRAADSCSVTCGVDGLCPHGSTCGGDGYCHAGGDSTVCSGRPGRADGAPPTDAAARDEDAAADAPDAAPPDADPCEGVPNRLGDWDSTDVAIPDEDFAGINRRITFQTSCVTVQSVEVYVEIIHPYRGDVRIRLTSPAGDTVVLLAPSEDANDDIFAAFDVDLAAGESADGTWTLNVSDVLLEFVGTLDYWSIGINRAAP